MKPETPVRQHSFRALASLGGVAVVTLVGHSLIPLNATTMGFSYLLLVLIVASTWGFLEAAVSSILATLLFNFFFLPPVGVNHRGPVSTRFDFNLEQLTHSSGSASVLLATGKNIRHRLRPVVISFGVLLFAGAMFLAGRLTKVGARPIFHQLTFQRRRVLGARFSPDGQTILYSAEWNGDSSDVYSTRADRPGARSRGMPGGEVLAVSSAGDVAILSKITVSLNFADTGTLALASTPFAHVRECQRLPGTLSVDSRFS